MDVEHNGTNISRLQGASNWDVWKFQVRLVLQDKGLIDIVTTGIDGGKEKPSEDVMKKEYSAQKIIGTTMTPDAAVHILSCTSAHGMWSKLHEVYELKNEMSAMAMNEQFLSSKKETEEIMSTFGGHVAT